MICVEPTRVEALYLGEVFYLHSNRPKGWVSTENQI